MALANYSDLQASVAAYVNRTDLTSFIPDFVRLCEADLNRKLRCRYNERRDTAFAVAGRYTNLPSDFAAMKRVVNVGSSRVEILPASLVESAEYATSGTPTRYSISAGQIELVPVGAATLELTYWRTVPDLATNSTNDVLTYCPNVYLFGACLHAGYFLDDASVIGKFESKFERAVADANAGSVMLGSGMAVRVA